MTEEIQEELVERYAFVVDKGQSSLRIDKYIHDKIQNISRNRIQNACKADVVLVNDKVVKANYKVKPNDKISILVAKSSYGPNTVEPQDIPLDIHFEDDDILIVNKPAGMVVHPGTGNYTGTLANAVSFYVNNLPENKDYDYRPGLVHRIDKLTSGIMVIAKTDFAMNFLARQFFERTVNRKYYALVWGDLEEDGTIRGNVGRDPKQRKKMTVFIDENKGKRAITHYQVLKRYGYVTLVKCKLETGRTHQIRIHFKSIGCPLFGDPDYGGNKVVKGTVFTKYKQFIENCFKILPRQALHAKKLGFMHPEKEEFLQFDSELPEDFQQVLDKWERYTQGRL